MSDGFDSLEPVDDIPPVPMSEDVLHELYGDDDSIETVWVPTARPAQVHTRAGAHSGDILKFHLETVDEYVTYTYTTSPDAEGLQWHRGKGTSKDHDDQTLVEWVEDLISDKCEPLEG